MYSFEYKTLNSSNVFYYLYKQYCSRKGQIPLLAIRPKKNDLSVLDFFADRIKYAEWEPILRALTNDKGLKFLAIRVRQRNLDVLEEVDIESKICLIKKRPVLLTRFLILCTLESVETCLKYTLNLEVLILEGIHLTQEYLETILKSLLTNRTILHIGVQFCRIGDEGCVSLCKYLEDIPNIRSIDLSYCDIGKSGIIAISDLIKRQNINRGREIWSQSLRYGKCDLNAQGGLRRITVNGNNLEDTGLKILLNVTQDDTWFKALDMQDCGLTNVGADCIMEFLKMNNVIEIIDIRCNPKVTSSLVKLLMQKLKRPCPQSEVPYMWLNIVRPFSSVKLQAKLPSNPTSPVEISPSTSTNSQEKYESRRTKQLTSTVSEKMSRTVPDPATNNSLITVPQQNLPTKSYNLSKSELETILRGTTVIEHSTINTHLQSNIEQEKYVNEAHANKSQEKSHTVTSPISLKDEIESGSKIFKKLATTSIPIKQQGLENQDCQYLTNSLSTQSDVFYDALSNLSLTSSSNRGHTTYFSESTTNTLTPDISSSSTRTIIMSSPANSKKVLETTNRIIPSKLPRRTLIRPGTSKSTPNTAVNDKTTNVSIEREASQGKRRNRVLQSSTNYFKASGDSTMIKK